MKMRLVFITSCAVLTIAETSHAQVRFNSVNVNFGVIRLMEEYRSKIEGFPYLFYPELQMGGDFFMPAIRWGISWGYWDEGLETTERIMDGYGYDHAYSGHIVGARFTAFLPELFPHWALPVGVIAGISHHWIVADYLYVWDYFGGPARTSVGHATTVDIGANIEVKVFGPVSIQGEVQHFILLGSKEFFREQIDRDAFKLGFSVRLE